MEAFTQLPQTETNALRAGRALLVERGWTKGALARNAAGNPSGPGDESCCYCALAALYAGARMLGLPANSDVMRRAESVLDATCREMHGLNVVRFNDRARTIHADVLALYDAAIAKAEPDPTSYPAAQAAGRLERFVDVAPMADETFDALGAEREAEVGS